MMRRTYAGKKRFDEPEVIPPGGTDWRSGHVPCALPAVPVDGRQAFITPWFGICVLAPPIVVLVVAILLALLGIFIMWLSVVGLIMAAIVASDLIRRSVRRWTRPLPGVLDPRAVGYPSR
jgi:hypothetical protein